MRPGSEGGPPVPAHREGSPRIGGSRLMSAGEEIRATPLARRLASGANLDLRTVSGSGPAGRITKSDVLAQLASEPRPESGLVVEWLGRVAFAEALEIQMQSLEARRRGRAPDRLLLLEHPPVVTLGRGAREENLLVSRDSLARRGIEIHRVARGGDVTYHAPGQLVGYLIVDLAAGGAPDVHGFVRSLELALVEALERLSVPALCIEGMTGVFIDRRRTAGARGGTGAELRKRRPSGAAPERKIASIGVGVRRWVTYHGFALNVSLDLAGFDAIVPCGLRGVEMTSVARELGSPGVELDARVRDAVAGAFRERFA
jgi:lipoyl(octanoyl) transferase